MPKFKYKAKKGPNEVIEGNIEVDSESAAVNKLLDSGLYLLWIKEESLLSKEKTGVIPFFSKGIKTKDVADFTRQLSELLDSGLALYESLNIIENQIAFPRLKEIVRGLRDNIKDGRTFSESLKAYPRIFSSLYINLVKSGEAGSMLTEVLANISDFLEKQEDARSRVLAALAYPMLMAGVGIVTIFILMTFVIPRLANMFVEMGEILPLPTRMLIGLSNFIKTYWLLSIFFVASLILYIKKSKANKTAKEAIDNFKLKMPIIGRLIHNTELARFSRTLSTLLKNGVPILPSLKITSEIIDNEIIKEEVKLIYVDVKAGSSLQAAMKKKSSFPQFIINMAAIGQEGGSLDKMLLKAAKNYELETDRVIKIMSSLLEPAVILIMGIIVGFIVISMLLPVFQISLTAQ